MKQNNEITRMLNDHLNKKQTAQRRQTYERKREELLKIEVESTPKDAIIIPRKNPRSFIFGAITAIVIIGIIGFVFATTNIGQQLDMGNNQIKSLANGTVGTDAVTKNYVDAASVPQGARLGYCTTSTSLCGGVGGYVTSEDLPGYGGNPVSGCNRNCYCSTGYTQRWYATNGANTVYICIKD